MQRIEIRYWNRVVCFVFVYVWCMCVCVTLSFIAVSFVGCMHPHLMYYFLRPANVVSFNMALVGEFNCKTREEENYFNRGRQCQWWLLLLDAYGHLFRKHACLSLATGQNYDSFRVRLISFQKRFSHTNNIRGIEWNRDETNISRIIAVAGGILRFIQSSLFAEDAKH